MINPIQAEANKSATYVDNYLDSVENLPEDMQRCLSRIRDIDSRYRTHLRDVDHYYDVWRALKGEDHAPPARVNRAIALMHQSLIAAQELGDEKMQIVTHLQDMVEHKTRQLDLDQKKLDIREEFTQQRIEQLQQADDSFSPTGSKLARNQSPVRAGEINFNGGPLGLSERYVVSAMGGLSASGSCKELNVAALQAYGNVSNGGGAGGSSTPNSERSVNLGNSVGGGVGGISNLNGAHNTSGEAQRGSTKRSRRRHDTANGSLELGGNESNSATEFSGGNERQKTGGNGNNKKHSGAQVAGNNAGMSGSGGSGMTNTSGGTSAAGGAGKKKKRKTRGVSGSGSAAQASAREETPPPDQIDPDEPTYCICNQISYGEMILCDNDLCPIEWFHFSCVSLVLKPKGKWFCPKCRGDRSNVMKPKAQFLKELERYNKEKEEKT